MIRINLCSTIAIDYLQTSKVNKLSGWQSEDWYSCRESAPSLTTARSLRYVCIQNFNNSVDLWRAVKLITESLLTMELHRPFMQWYMDTYQLEGSLLHHVETEDQEVPCAVGAPSAKTESSIHGLADVLKLREQTQSDLSVLSKPGEDSIFCNLRPST